MLLGELTTLWTVRLALLGYFVGAYLRAAPRVSMRWRVGRIAWTCGCLFYVAHVACAFHFFHGWSHQAAYQRTAEQTMATTGWRWGGGLYFNYVFSILWLADTAWCWRKTAGREYHWLQILVQVFLWFMVFNATVVFGHGAVRWFGLAGCTVLAVAACTRRRRALVLTI